MKEIEDLLATMNTEQVAVGTLLGILQAFSANLRSRAAQEKTALLLNLLIAEFSHGYQPETISAAKIVRSNDKD